MKKIISICLFLCIAQFYYYALAQEIPSNFPFRNTTLSTEARVNDLVSRMTLKRKRISCFTLLLQFQGLAFLHTTGGMRLFMV